MDKILSLLGLAYRGRNLESGESPVLSAILSRKARLVLAAEDSADNTKRMLKNRTADTEIPLFEIPCSKSDLGHAIGKQSCSMVAITDSGFALTVLNELVPEDQYTELRQKLKGIVYRKSLRQKQRRRR